MIQRKVGLTDMLLDIVILAFTLVLLYEVHINLVYALLIQIGYKVYILIDTYMQMLARSKQIAESLSKLDFTKMSDGVFVAKLEEKEEKDVQQNASDDSSKP